MRNQIITAFLLTGALAAGCGGSDSGGVSTSGGSGTTGVSTSGTTAGSGTSGTGTSGTTTAGTGISGTVTGGTGGTGTGTSGTTTGGTGTSVPIPAAYAALYTADQTYLSQFSSAVNAAYPTPLHTSKVYVDLLDANSNAVYLPLMGADTATVQRMATNAVAAAASMQKLLGISGVTLSVNYPILVQNSANLPNANFTTANYATYLAYYTQVVQGLRAMGLGIDVESNVIFPSQIGAGYSYDGITVTQLESGVAEDAQNVIDNLKVDRVNLVSEPLTLSENTGLTSLNNPANYAAFVQQIHSQISLSASPTTKLGAGVADWQSSDFITALVAADSNLDFYDLHLYPPAYLQQGLTQLQQLQATGKTVVVTETWLDKEDTTGTAGNSSVSPQDVQILDAYSFWGPLDAQYITSLMQAASGTGVASVNLFYSNELLAYVPYNSTTAAYTYQQIVQALSQAAGAAAAAGNVSASGQAVLNYTQGSQSQ